MNKDTQRNNQELNGELLYNNILKNVHKNDINEMYKYFKHNIAYIDAYGDTIEKRLLNYCTYKSSVVYHMYNIR